MTDSTIMTRRSVPQEQPTPAKPKQPRQMVRFTFYKLDPQWQLLPLEQRERGKQELIRIVSEQGEHTLMRSLPSMACARTAILCSGRPPMILLICKACIARSAAALWVPTCARYMAFSP